MAVETKFVVVRKGEEKMTFASKKEADAYDKMLDMAEAFTDWLLQSELQLDEAQGESLGLFLAEQKDAVQHILRTSKLPDVASAAKARPAAAGKADDGASNADAASNADGASNANDAASNKKVRAVKAA